MLASGSGDKTVRLWDLTTELPFQTCEGHPNWVLCIAFSPNGKKLASACKSGEVWNKYVMWMQLFLFRSLFGIPTLANNLVESSPATSNGSMHCRGHRYTKIRNQDIWRALEKIQQFEFGTLSLNRRYAFFLDTLLQSHVFDGVVVVLFIRDRR